MIRFILCLILVIFYFVIMIPIEIIGFVTGLFSKNAKDAYMKFMMHIVFFTLNGIAGAKATAGAVYLALHDGTKEEIKAYVDGYYADEIDRYDFCPADVEILAKLKQDYGLSPR